MINLNVSLMNYATILKPLSCSIKPLAGLRRSVQEIFNSKKIKTKMIERNIT